MELLRTDHDKVRGLFHEFRAAAEGGDARQMEELCRQIFRELEVHTAIEEEVFYPAVKDAGGEDLRETTAESYEEHHVVDLLMSEVERLDPGGEAFVAKMRVLMENVEHHASEEEEEMFPEVRRLMDQDRLSRLGEELKQAKVRRQASAASLEELKEQARELGVEGRSNMTKEELAVAISQRGVAR